MYRHSGLLHFSMVELLITLILLFMISPLAARLTYGALIESALVTLVLVASVMAVGARRRTLNFAIVLVLPAVAARWANHIEPRLVPHEFILLASLVFMLFVVVNLIGFILRAAKINMEVLCAAIAGYLLLGLIWAYAYMILSGKDPSAFAATSGELLDQFSATYFSYMTLTTTGFGDITPVSDTARMLAVMETMTGTFYVTVLIARLVAMYSADTRPPKSGASETD